MYTSFRALLLLICLTTTAFAQSSEQRLWRLGAGMASGHGDELLSAAYEPGPDVYAAVDFVTRTTRGMRSIGYYAEYARFSYDDGAFWTLIRNASGSTGGTVIKGGAASLASLGIVGKIGPIYGRTRPYASLGFGLFRNARGNLTVPGLNPGETAEMELGSKSGVQTVGGVGIDFMGRRLGVTADAGYQFNWTSSRLDKRWQICEGSDCSPAAASSQTLYVRVGVALVRGTF